MDFSSHSINESSLPDIIGVAEIEADVVEDMKMLDKEVDEALVNAFNDISENEDKSANDSESELEGNEQNLHTDSSFTSGRDLSSAFSTDNPTLPRRSNTEYENELANDSSHSKTEESYKQNPASNLQDSQNLTSDYQHEENILLKEIADLKLQLSSIQTKYEDSDVEIQSLKTQLSQLNKNGQDSSALHGQYKSILEGIKLQQERDILNYKKDIDRLQSSLNSKEKDAKHLAFENSELQKKYQQLQMKNAELATQMYEEFLAQKKCQLFLESGTLEEISRLKREVHRLEEEKSCMEKQKSYSMGNFLQQWCYSLFFWQLRCLHRVGHVVGLPFCK